MNNTEKYRMISEGETVIPSNMGIIPSGNTIIFSQDYIQEALASSKDFTVLSFQRNLEADIVFTARIEYLQEKYEVEIYLSPASEIGLHDFGFANQINERDFNTALLQTEFIEVSLFFGTNPLESFHLQLKILNAIVPDASLVVDFMSYRLLSAQWLKMTAKSSIPPSPDYLYTIHGVYNEEGEETKYWLHTHGLLRCKIVELEIVNISTGPKQINDLITMVVKKFLKDPAKENEKFQIGYDGLGINLAWIRWEEAIRDFPENILGGAHDREGDNNVHAEPSGILFAVEDNNFVSPQIYASTLADNPIYYISNEETKRMSDLAKERFPFFKDAFEKYIPGNTGKPLTENGFNKKEEEDSSWGFIVKLGLTVDDAQAETDKEHLWFDVVAIEGDKKIEGKLLNQPYWISSLHEGDINKYPVELLTDWIIYSPDGAAYTTDSIYQLGYSDL